VAATWAVLGTQGVLQYDRLRRHVNKATDTISDTFHDGTAVLEVVTQWHEYLRLSSRRTDHFTADILSMVDRHMLVVPAETRWDATQVCNHLGSVLAKDTPATPEVSKSIETMLQAVDIDPAPQMNYPQISRSNKGGSRMLTAYQRPQSTDVGLGLQITSPVCQPPSHFTSPPETAVVEMASLGSNTIPDSRDGILSTPKTHNTAKPGIQDPITIWELEEELEQNGKRKSLRILKSPSIISLGYKLRRHRNASKARKGKVDLLEPFYRDQDVVRIPVLSYIRVSEL
jgi:hypothetical protein